MSDKIIKQLKEIKPLRTMSMYINKEDLLKDKCWDRYSNPAYETDCAPYNVIYKEQFDELYKNEIQQPKQQLEVAVMVVEIAQKLIKENPEHLAITQVDLISNKWHERARQFLAKYRGEK